MTSMNLPNMCDSEVSHSSNSSSLKYHSIEAKDDLMEQVYALRYQSYGAYGYIKENNDEKFIDEFDALSNNISYLAYHKQQAIGSIRASIYDPKSTLPIPAMEIFYDEIKEYCGLDRPLVECNKFVIAPNFQRRSSISARFSLFRKIVEVALSIDAKYILGAVRPEHVNFYKVLNFIPISELKSYKHLSFKTVLLACIDLPASKKIIWKKTGGER